MSLTATAILVTCIPVLIAGVVAIVWDTRRRRRLGWTQKARGTEPGQGYSIVTASFCSGNEGGGGGGASIHPKDPQAHAKAFLPSTGPKY